MKLISLLAAPLALAAVLVASTARADVPPDCSSFDQSASCEAADVGKDCAGGGTCREISCGGENGPADKLTKCVTCPVVVDDPGKVCNNDFSSFGKACGDGGTCIKAPGYCPVEGTNYIFCAKDPPQGAGGAAGSGGSGQAGEAGAAGAGEAGQAAAGSGGSGQAGSGQAGSGMTGGGQAGSGTAGSAAAGAAGSESPGAAAATDDDSGCSVAAAGRHGALAGLMLALGAATLLADRRRRSR